MQRIILASTSKSRYNLLKKLKIPFKMVSPNCDETPHPGEPADKLVRRLAQEKAQSIAKSYANTLIIGADQVAEFRGQILGKPGNFTHAKQMLTLLAGHHVTFYTGMCLLDTYTMQSVCCVEPTTVAFRQLTETMIENYIRKDEPYHSAGSFQVEGLGITLFEKITGDDPNALIGLPLIKLVSMLQNHGVDILNVNNG